MENKSANLFKKALAVAMVIVMCFCTVPYSGFFGIEAEAADSSEKTQGNYVYTVKDKKATIVSTDGELRGSVKIPSKLGGYPVTSIDALAFMFSTFITDVTIPDTVETIGSGAFASCSLLRSVKIGKGLKKLEDNPFSGCELLSKIEVSSDNDYFSSDDKGVLFNKNKTVLISFPAGLALSEYTVPEGVKTIGISAFADNSKITAVNLPSSLTEIEDQAFNSCLSLKTVNAPDTLFKVGLDAFTDTAWFSAVPNSVVYLGKVVCGYNGEGASPVKIEVAEGTLGIASGAFAYITDTQELHLPASLKYIGEAGVISAGFKKITVDPANNNFTADTSGVLYSKDMKTLIAYPAAAAMSLYRVSSETEKIGDGAFGAAMYLLEIELPSSVKSIGEGAFTAAMSLEKVKMSKNITDIGEGAFSFCMSLKSISVPDGVKKIKDGVFTFCTSLTSVKFGKNVSSIGMMAFSGCSSLKKLTLGGKIKTIGEDAFNSCSGLTSVAFGKNVKTLKGNPFVGCESLKKFTVDSANKYFSTDGFGVLCNKKLTKLIAYPTGMKNTVYSVPKTVTAIGAYAFKDAARLKTVSLSEKTKTVGDYAFADCIKLRTMNLTSVTTVGEYAFDYCENLEKVYFSTKIKSVGEAAFEGCDDLSDVYYSGTKKQWKKVKFAEYEDFFSEGNPVEEADKHYGHKHTYGKGKTSIKPNYLRNGFKIYTCSECGCVKTTDTAKLKLKKVNISSVKSSKKKQLTVKWATVKDASGYQIKYSTSAKFTDKTSETATAKKQDTTKFTIKKLKSGKKYYVKVRAYKTVSGTNVYGSYSKTLTAKVK